MNTYLVAAVWIALALAASIVSIRLGLAVALAEILVGAIAGNTPLVSQLVEQTAITTFLASVGSVTLTFLAGAEIDPVSLRRHWRPSLCIGLVSFLVPFAAAMAVAYFVLRWTVPAAEIAGVALSTTSVAVVYAVMVETGLNTEDLGKLILAACFVTDLGTVLALGVLFAGFSVTLLVFAAVTTGVTVGISPALVFVRKVFGRRVSEPEIKFLFLVLFGLGGLATAAGSEAVLPAYVIGLAAARVFHADHVLMERMRAIAFAFLTPFFFLRAGILISVYALVGGAGLIAILFSTKLAAKLAGVWPVAALFGIRRRDRNYVTLLMATGLTFGSISALYGLNHGLVSRDQYSILVSVVILSAVIPTLIAQRLFQPRIVDDDQEDALAAEDASIVHRRSSA